MPPSPTGDAEAPLLLVGGGLANGLIAWRLAETRPEVPVRVLEAADRLGGVHTWSFFQSDLTEGQRAWIDPLIAHRWPGYEVRFPSHSRRLTTPYASVTAERFHQRLIERLGARVTLGAAVTALGADHVVLGSGETLRGRAVIDGRGPGATPDLALGFQKFVGQEWRLSQPHGLTQPIVMDATVSQEDGYRFVYVLPFDDRTVLVEDTRYTDGDALDAEAYREGVRRWLSDAGWTPETLIREEHGVLPVALDGDLEAHWDRQDASALSGLRAGLFHPTTGYSLPDAVRAADLIAALPVIDTVTVSAALRDHALRLWRERAFYRLLNRMLFRAAAPHQRRRILERFYRLPQPLIERFYAGRATLGDKARILAGKPPVPIGRALACLPERGAAPRSVA
ncbi:lycopene beta-cyclase CrtY [Brevundimonas lutea]|uniref:lycopene beta-cyclase CrtY n=1 Tax=Brevundimonas lutea TaxID=2293980 RepID=UPI000F02074D|nr:lycopene beta-cyclase CrtY [Brevundimonas lutea]